MSRYAVIFMLNLAVCSTGIHAQTVAENWTQTDCDGVEHDLFTTLDTGSAVVMEFVMLESCMPCINAAHMMAPIIERYDNMYDDRVQYYTFGYNDTYACEDFAAWETDNAIANDAALLLGADIGSYYGGMGMPTIVVVGRNTHTVYFNQFGFVIADTTDFSAALSYALGITDPETAISTSSAETMQISPNPVIAQMHINGNIPYGSVVQIMDMQGRLMTTLQTDASGNIDVHQLPVGMYVLQIESMHGTSRASFMKL